jgi:hypothetical protein
MRILQWIHSTRGRIACLNLGFFDSLLLKHVMLLKRDTQIVRVRVTLRLTVSQSVCLDVVPRLGLMARYLIRLKVTVLSIWGALSDERSGLSFVSHSRQ